MFFCSSEQEETSWGSEDSLSVWMPDASACPFICLCPSTCWTSRSHGQRPRPNPNEPGPTEHPEDYSHEKTLCNITVQTGGSLQIQPLDDRTTCVRIHGDVSFSVGARVSLHVLKLQKQLFWKPRQFTTYKLTVLASWHLPATPIQTVQVEVFLKGELRKAELHCW